MDLKVVSDSEPDISANPITNKNEIEVSVGPFRIVISTTGGPLGRLLVYATLKYDANQSEIPVALHFALEKGINVPEYQEGGGLILPRHFAFWKSCASLLNDR